MKTLRFLLCALLLFPVFHAKAAAADDVEMRLRDFYSFYCHALEGKSPLTHPDTLKPYVSARFLKEIARLSKQEGGMDADPFVCAQDNDPAWEKNIKVANVKAAADGKTAIADVTLAGQPDMVRRLHVSLVSEAGVYKVDKVKASDL